MQLPTTACVSNEMLIYSFIVYVGLVDGGNVLDYKEMGAILFMARMRHLISKYSVKRTRNIMTQHRRFSTYVMVVDTLVFILSSITKTFIKISTVPHILVM